MRSRAAIRHSSRARRKFHVTRLQDRWKERRAAPRTRRESIFNRLEVQRGATRGGAGGRAVFRRGCSEVQRGRGKPSTAERRWLGGGGVAAAVPRQVWWGETLSRPLRSLSCSVAAEGSVLLRVVVPLVAALRRVSLALSLSSPSSLRSTRRRPPRRDRPSWRLVTRHGETADERYRAANFSVYAQWYERRLFRSLFWRLHGFVESVRDCDFAPESNSFPGSTSSSSLETGITRRWRTRAEDRGRRQDVPRPRSLDRPGSSYVFSQVPRSGCNEARTLIVCFVWRWQWEQFCFCFLVSAFCAMCYGPIGLRILCLVSTVQNGFSIPTDRRLSHFFHPEKAKTTVKIGYRAPIYGGETRVIGAPSHRSGLIPNRALTPERRNGMRRFETRVLRRTRNISLPLPPCPLPPAAPRVLWACDVKVEKERRPKSECVGRKFAPFTVKCALFGATASSDLERRRSWLRPTSQCSVLLEEMENLACLAGVISQCNRRLCHLGNEIRGGAGQLRLKSRIGARSLDCESREISRRVLGFAIVTYLLIDVPLVT